MEESKPVKRPIIPEGVLPAGEKPDPTVKAVNKVAIPVIKKSNENTVLHKIGTLTDKYIDYITLIGGLSNLALATFNLAFQFILYCIGSKEKKKEVVVPEKIPEKEESIPSSMPTFKTYEHIKKFKTKENVPAEIRFLEPWKWETWSTDSFDKLVNIFSSQSKSTINNLLNSLELKEHQTVVIRYEDQVLIKGGEFLSFKEKATSKELLLYGTPDFFKTVTKEKINSEWESAAESIDTFLQKIDNEFSQYDQFYRTIQL